MSEPFDDYKRKYESILSTGPDMVEMVQNLIAKEKTPFRVDIIVEGEKRGWGVIASVLTRGEQELARFITQNEEMSLMKADAKTISETPYETLISGPTGTGKELIARSQIGKRTGAICAVNCAGFPEHLFESELFGHVRGAFTGADASREGLLQVAKGGVIFLDEVTELPLHLQAKLLRAIQDKRIRPVGEEKLRQTLTVSLSALVIKT
jgi:transcriptional regulator with PAS, ATPase and Fis domain